MAENMWATLSGSVASNAIFSGLGQKGICWFCRYLFVKSAELFYTYLLEPSPDPSHILEYLAQTGLAAKKAENLRQLYSDCRAFQGEMQVRFNLKLDDVPIPDTGPSHRVNRTRKRQANYQSQGPSL